MMPSSIIHHFMICFFLFLEVSLTRRADLLLVFIQVFDICQRYKYIPRLGAIEFDIHSLFG